MSSSEIWSVVHAERAALIGDLEGLAPEQWETSSLCEGWTVHDVAAHLVDSARTTRIGFLVALAAARFDFDRLNQRGVDRERGEDPSATLTRLRQVAGRSSTPPASLDTRVVEEIAHGEDIRRPLGIHRDYPIDAVIRALRLQARTPASFGGAKELVGRVRLQATDTDLELGAGPRVEGPVLALLLVVSGRRSAVEELSGEGLDVFQQA